MLPPETIAETAIDSCKTNGYSVSAAVVDRTGEVIVALRGDNASLRDSAVDRAVQRPCSE